jgi:hypothetical protein
VAIWWLVLSQVAIWWLLWWLFGGYLVAFEPGGYLVAIAWLFGGF